MKRFGCLALSVMLLFGGFGIYRAAFPPRLSGPSFQQLSPQTQKQRRVEAQTLVEQVESIARDARRKDSEPKSKTFTVEASEEQLNTLLQDRLRTEKFPISDLRIGLSKQQITVQGIAKYGGIDWPASISGTLEAQNGALSYRIQSLTVSGRPAPAKLRAKAQDAIESGLQKAFSSENRARIDSVEIEPGKLTVRGQTR